jgi:aminoglycoside phosphotransferase
VNHLPLELKRIIGTAKWEKDTVGMSGAGVYKLTGIESGGNAYLKTAKLGGPETLKEEMEKMIWLTDNALVPKVLHFDTDGTLEYLLITEIPGNNLRKSGWGAVNPVEMGEKLAAGLKTIHQIDIINCPFDATLPVKLGKAKQRIQAGLVDTSDFEPDHADKTAEELYSLLEKSRPEEELVFTHGDFSLANIMAFHNQISGFVDWGRAGMSDRHQDLAIAIRSLKHHFTDEAVEAFIDTYGRSLVDFERVEYYILLDELF